MGIGLSSADYYALQNDYVMNNRYRMANYQGRAQRTSQNGYANYAVSKQGNTCTDGKDDGKIGFFSAAGNVIEGAGKAFGNMVKGMITHPLKTAATIALCCVPVVGPAFAIGLGAFGVFQGVKTIANAASTVSNAKTDADAKDAWEAIGNGTFTTAASVGMIKGGAHMLKGQLGGASTTVNAVKAAKNSGAKFSELAKTAAEEGFKETVGNISGLAGKVYKKAKETGDKIKDFGDCVKENGLKKTVYEYSSKSLESVSNKVQNASEKIAQRANKKAGELKTKAEATKTPTQIKQEAVTKANNAKAVQGAEVQLYEGSDVPKSIKIPKSDGGVVVEEFANSGKLLRRTEITKLPSGQYEKLVTEGDITTLETGKMVDEKFQPSSKKVTNKRLGIETEESTSTNSDGTKKVHTKTQTRLDENGVAKDSVSTRQTTVDNKTTTKQTFSDGTYSLDIETIDGETTVTTPVGKYLLKDGKFIDNAGVEIPEVYAKILKNRAQITFNSSAAGKHVENIKNSANEFIDKGSDKTNAGLMYFGFLTEHARKNK